MATGSPLSSTIATSSPEESEATTSLLRLPAGAKLKGTGQTRPFSKRPL